MQKKIRKRMFFTLFIVLACLLWIGGSYAQDYPKSPVQIVIPFGSGGLTDIFWRSTSEFMASHMKATIILVNKPGGGGVVGTSFGANAKPDGYTLVSANSDPLSMSPVFTPNVPYNPETDFTYIAKMAAFAFTISVRSDSAFKTIEEVIAFAKANPKKLKTAVMGIGSTPHIILEVFNRDAKIEITPVPFDSGGESVTNLLGGHTDLCIASLPSLKSHVLAGKARILAFCSPKRLSDFPDIPTLGEKGYQKASIATGVGLAGPKGLAPAIASKWEEAMDRTMKDPKVIAVIEKLGGVVIDFKSGEGYKKDLMADLTTFKEILPTLPAKK
ncbi:MAG: tripartite tricarboxylate transporter substrate binding protein [Deltaproteobacteria bacterium]|nr:tripartite tricarboxylate transporter substrate binding protein [Deltaproteobacteria bacterium]MBM4323235.1 tripartite tricarboxylate transporter substrate binding protein [Deltaproteobacteria bacterium]